MLLRSAILLLVASAASAALLECDDGRTKLLSCANDVTVCAKAFGFMAPAPACSAGGVCAWLANLSKGRYLLLTPQYPTYGGAAGWGGGIAKGREVWLPLPIE